MNTSYPPSFKYRIINAVKNNNKKTNYPVYFFTLRVFNLFSLKNYQWSLVSAVVQVLAENKQ